MSLKAKELNIENYTSYDRLEKLIAKYDSEAKNIAGHFFENRAEADKQRIAYKIYKDSKFTESIENASKAQNDLVEYSQANGINVQWLLIDVEYAIKHFLDLSRICFQYTYDTPEKARDARENEDLFFLAVWSLLNRCNQAGKLKKQASLVNTINSVMKFVRNSVQSNDSGKTDINQAYKVFNLPPTEQIFIFISADLGNSNSTGVAITSSGIFWSNGSSVMSQISSTKVFGKLFGQKAETIKASSQVQHFWISWREIITMPGSIICTGDNKLTFPDGRFIDSKTIDVMELKDIFETIREWGKKCTIQFSDSPKYFNQNLFQNLPQITPLPKEK